MLESLALELPIRLFRRSILTELSPEIRYASFFAAEFAIRAHFAGYRIKQVPMRPYARKIGSTAIFLVYSLFAICFRQFVGISMLKKEFHDR